MNVFLWFLGSEICDDSNVLNVFYFFEQLLSLAFIIIPVGAILILSFDMFKNVIANDEGVQKKNMNLFIKRIIFLVVVFLVPYIVRFFVGFVSDSLGIEKNGYLKCLSVTKEDINEQLKQDKSECKESGGKWVSSTNSCSNPNSGGTYSDDYDFGGSSGSKGSSNSGSKNSSSSGPTKASNNIFSKDGWVKKFGKIYYYENGEKVKGRKKIGNSYYYFSKKKGVMKTGFVKVKKGDKNIYYYFKKKGKNKGKQLFGKVRAKGPYNGTNRKDTWYFNKNTGKLEEVKLAVKQINQSGYNCGPTSLNMVVSYHTGKTFGEESFAEHCGHATFGYKKCTKENGVKWNSKSPSQVTKRKLLNQLFSGRPFIFEVTCSSCGSMGQLATQLNFTGGGGHVNVISGYKDGRFIMSNPNPNGVQSSTWTTLKSVAVNYHYFRSKKKR